MGITLSWCSEIVLAGLSLVASKQGIWVGKGGRMSPGLDFSTHETVTQGSHLLHIQREVYNVGSNPDMEGN